MRPACPVTSPSRPSCRRSPTTNWSILSRPPSKRERPAASICRCDCRTRSRLCSARGSTRIFPIALPRSWRRSARSAAAATTTPISSAGCAAKAPGPSSSRPASRSPRRNMASNKPSSRCAPTCSARLKATRCACFNRRFYASFRNRPYVVDMYDFLLLPMLGLCTASFFTAVGDRFLARKLPDCPLGRRLALASLAAPAAWIAFQALTLTIILPQPGVYAGLMSKWPLYLQDVLFGIALKLWICGAICAAVLACYRKVAGDPQVSQRQAQLGLLNIGGALAAAILLPLALDYWIETGQLSGAFVLFVMAWAYLLGGLPIAAAALALLRLAGPAGLRRF